MIGSSSSSLSTSDRCDRDIPSLDSYVQITPNPSPPLKPSSNRGSWSHQQKRVYHRCMSLLHYWMSYGYQILWVTLTSSNESDVDQMNDHFTTLKKRIERTFSYASIEHLAIRTDEGNGVYHLFLAYKLQKGRRQKRFYIPQGWLSKQWNDIHSARVVWIKHVENSPSSKKRLSRYCVSQYCANQNLLRRVSWSWKRGLGGALVGTWNSIKDTCVSGKSEALSVWNRVLSGETVILKIPGVLLGYVVHPPPHLYCEDIPVVLPSRDRLLSDYRLS